MKIINKNKYKGEFSPNELEDLEYELKQIIMEAHWEWLDAVLTAFRDTTEDYLDAMIQDPEYYKEYKNKLADISGIIEDCAWDSLSP